MPQKAVGKASKGRKIMQCDMDLVSPTKMANICMDFVRFFAEGREQEEGLERLASDFSACYPEE